jgi:hypothetical protein
MASLTARLSALALGATLALTSCGGSPSGPAPASGSPTTSASGTAGTGTPSPLPVSTPAAAGYPGDGQSYAQATLTAWVGGQATRVAELTTADAAGQLTGIGHPESHWNFYHCDGAAGSAYCMFDNNDGDRLRLRVVTRFLGQAHAVAEVVISRTPYPSDPDSYLTAFLQAWRDGNTLRMTALGSADVTAYFSHLTAPSSWTFASDGTAGHTHIHITGPTGFSQYVVVVNVSLGHPHAIGTACGSPC